MKKDETQSFYESVKETLKSFTQSKESITTNLLNIVGMNGLDNGANLRSLYGEVQTVHEEMRDVEEMYRQNSYVVTAVNLVTDAVFGRNPHLEFGDVEGVDEDVLDEINHSVLKELHRGLREAVSNMVKTGNGYIELLRDDSGVLRGFEVISRSHDMYIVSEDGEVTRYYYRLPNQQDRYSVDGSTVDNENIERIRIRTGSHRSEYFRAVRFEPNEILHLRMGNSHLGLYGRSPLCSSTDDFEVLRELERNEAVVSREKATNTKLFSVKDSEGRFVSDKELRKFKELYEISNDNEMFFNRDIEQVDISHSGKHVNQEATIKYFTRKIVTSLAPDFYMFGETTNYAVAEEEKNVFLLRVEHIRSMIQEEIDVVVKEYVENNLRRGVNPKYVFGDFDFVTKTKRRENALEQYQAGLITFNEARDMMGLVPTDEDIGGMYRFDIEPQQNNNEVGNGGVQRTLRDLMKQ